MSSLFAQAFKCEIAWGDEVYNVLRKADWENKRRFHDFCAVLKLGMRIGKVSIGSNQTVRTGFSGTKMIQRSLINDLSTGVIAEDLISNFRSSATKWDTVDPDAILTELRAIHDYRTFTALLPQVLPNRTARSTSSG